jgi:Integrase zinc binding domain
VAYLSPQFTSTDYFPSLPEHVWKEETRRVPKDQLPTGDNVAINNGIVSVKLKHGTVMWAPPAMRNKLIQLYHEPPCVGHKGRNKTYKAMIQDVYWSRMERDIMQFISRCIKCQFKNYGSKAAPYKVTTIPTNCFEEISLDVVGPMPNTSNGHRYVLCIQDRLSRWVSFTPMPNAGAEMTCRVFLKEWIVIFGPPRKLLTDRGTNFTSIYFHELAKFLRIQPPKQWHIARKHTGKMKGHIVTFITISAYLLIKGIDAIGIFW